MNSTTPRKKIKKGIRIVIALAFWLGLWQLLSMIVAKQLLLPSPVAVVIALAKLAFTGEFWAATGLSMLRIFGGFAAGVALGTVFAVLTSLFEPVDIIVSPAMRVARTVPVASFIILLLLWTGRASAPVIAVMVMVMPLIWKNVKSGIETTDPLLLEMAKSYRFGTLKTLRLVYLPSILPAFSAACVTSLGFAWKAGVAAEVLCQPRSAIGTELYYSKIYLETPSLFAWTAVVVALSWLLEVIMLRLLKTKKEGGENA